MNIIRFLLLKCHLHKKEKLLIYFFVKSVLLSMIIYCHFLVCYKWHKKYWIGQAPSSPIDSDCGQNTCTSCGELNIEHFKVKSKFELIIYLGHIF